MTIVDHCHCHLHISLSHSHDHLSTCVHLFCMLWENGLPIPIACWLGCMCSWPSPLLVGWKEFMYTHDPFCTAFLHVFILGSPRPDIRRVLYSFLARSHGPRAARCILKLAIGSSWPGIRALQPLLHSSVLLAVSEGLNYQGGAPLSWGRD